MASNSNAFAPYVDGPGLKIVVAAGTVLAGGSVVARAAATLSFAASTTNYVFLDSTGALTSNTTGYPASALLPIAKVVTNTGGILSLRDDRPDVFGMVGAINISGGANVFGTYDAAVLDDTAVPLETVTLMANTVVTPGNTTVNCAASFTAANRGATVSEPMVTLELDATQESGSCIGLTALAGFAWNRSGTVNGRIIGLSVGCENDGTCTLDMISLWVQGGGGTCNGDNYGIQIGSQKAIGVHNYGLWIDDHGSGAADWALYVKGGRCALGAPATAPTTANMQTGQISFYLDEAGNNLKVSVKYSNGTTKTATVALA